MRLYQQLLRDDCAELRILAHPGLRVAYPELDGSHYVALGSPLRAVRVLRRAGVIVANTPLACLVGVVLAGSVPLRRRPTVLHLVHSVPRGWPRTWVVRAASRRASVRSCVSYSLAKSWVQPLRVDPLGVGPGEAVPEPESVSSVPSVFAMGRPAHVKGLDLYIESLICSGKPDRTADVVLGLTETDSAYSRRLISDVPGWMVVRTGIGPSTMRSGDILVVPSRAETAALLVQEAMGRGIIVVATPVGDVPLLIDDGATGFVAADVSVHAIGVALRRALDLDAPSRLKVAVSASRASKAREGEWERVIATVIKDCLLDVPLTRDIK